MSYLNIIVIIEDNGVGMTTETMNSLWRNKDKNEQSNLIGMKNITNRIKLYYGDTYGLTVTSNIGDGAKILVTIPKCY